MRKFLLTLISLLIAAGALWPVPAFALEKRLNAKDACNTTAALTYQVLDELREGGRRAWDLASGKAGVEYAARPAHFDEVADLTSMHRSLVRELSLGAEEPSYHNLGLHLDSAAPRLMLVTERTGVAAVDSDMHEQDYRLHTLLYEIQVKPPFGRWSPEGESDVERSPDQASDEKRAAQLHDVQFYSLFSTELKNEEQEQPAADQPSPEPGGLALLIAGVLGICAVARPRILST
jgi:hypothetical protein